MLFCFFWKYFTTGTRESHYGDVDATVGGKMNIEQTKKWRKRLAPIRWSLTGLLIYGVWTETGIWTAIAFLLIAVSLEMLSDAILLLCETIRMSERSIEYLGKAITIIMEQMNYANP